MGMSSLNNISVHRFFHISVIRYTYLGRRVSRLGGRPLLEYLVRWKGYDAKDDEWYPRYDRGL